MTKGIPGTRASTQAIMYQHTLAQNNFIHIGRL